MSQKETAKQLKLLKERVDELEHQLDTIHNTPHAFDVAAEFRDRLKKVESFFRILAVDIDLPNVRADGCYPIHRVLTANNEKFLVCKSGQSYGVLRNKITIENWIKRLEEEYADKSSK